MKPVNAPVGFFCPKDDVAKAIEAARIVLCCYTAQPCDCKYGLRPELLVGRALPIGEQTGCPELSVARDLFAIMTPFEFDRLKRRHRKNQRRKK